jgi:hypothetical protein
MPAKIGVQIGEVALEGAEAPDHLVEFAEDQIGLVVAHVSTRVSGLVSRTGNRCPG